jgi:uncharacterized protein
MRFRTPPSLVSKGLFLVGGFVSAGFVVAGPHSLQATAPGFPAPATPAPVLPASPDVVGSWEGALAVTGDMRIRIVFHIAEAADGSLQATMDSPDQAARGIPVASATYGHGHLVLEVTAVGGRFEGYLAEPDRLEGNWTQGGTAFPLELARVEEVTEPSRPQDPEPPFPYRSEEVRYPNAEAGIHLAGTLTLPEGPGPFPAVTLVTGSGAQNRDSEIFGHRIFLVLADHLTRRGIAVLRSDDRGVGESEGDFRAATSADFAGDTRAAVEYLLTRPEVDPTAVGIVGMSEGGLIAPMVAAETDDVAFLVLLAGPGVPGEELLFRQGELISRAMGASDQDVERSRALQARLFAILREETDPGARRHRLEGELRGALALMTEEERRAGGITADTEDGWVRSQLAPLEGPWFRYFLLHDPAPVLRGIQVPVLALNGSLDLQVDAAQNLPAIESALRQGGNPDFTVEEVPGLNHLFQTATTGAPAEYARIEETFAPVALDRIADWIVERFGG